MRKAPRGNRPKVYFLSVERLNTIGLPEELVGVTPTNSRAGEKWLCPCLLSISIGNRYSPESSQGEDLHPLEGPCQVNNIPRTRNFLFLAGILAAHMPNHPSWLLRPFVFSLLWLAVSSAPRTHRDIRSLSVPENISVPCQSNRSHRTRGCKPLMF